MAGGSRKKNADDLVLHQAEPLGTAPAVPVLEQHGLRFGARRDQFALEQLGHRGAKDVLASGMLLGQRIDRGGDARGVEKGRLSLPYWLCYEVVHDLTGYRTAPALSRNIVRAASQAGFAGVEGVTARAPGWQWSQRNHWGNIL